MMATFGSCFSDEVGIGRSSCPTNADCSLHYGMCICLPGYYKNNTGCVSHSFRSHNIDDASDNFPFQEKHEYLSTLPTLMESTLAVLSNEHELKEEAVFTVGLTGNTTENTNTVAENSNSIEKDIREIETTTKQTTSSTTTSISSKKTSHARITQSKWDSIPLSSTHSYVPWQMRSWKNNDGAQERSS